MPKAYIGLRHEPGRRRKKFVQGLEAAGFSCNDCIRPSGAIDPWPPKGPQEGNILLIWNRGGKFERMAIDFETLGGRVIVTENGYLPTVKGEKTYALALTEHNGAGHWHVGSYRRWEKLGHHVEPWRKKGSHILVCAQRSIGSRKMGMPQGWQYTVVKRIKQHTDRIIKIREHPQRLRHIEKSNAVELSDELQNAHCIVVWSSGCANWSLVAGIPVIYQAPTIVGAPAALSSLERIEDPYLGSREEAFSRIAWAQWTGDELATGEPFERILKEA